MDFEKNLNCPIFQLNQNRKIRGNFEFHRKSIVFSFVYKNQRIPITLEYRSVSSNIENRQHLISAKTRSICILIKNRQSLILNKTRAILIMIKKLINIDRIYHKSGPTGLGQKPVLFFGQKLDNFNFALKSDLNFGPTSICLVND